MAATSNLVTATTRPGLLIRETCSIGSSDDNGYDNSDQNDDGDDDDNAGETVGDAEKHQINQNIAFIL